MMPVHLAMLRRAFDRLAGARWREARHEHRSIVRGIILVGSFAVAARLVAAAKEVAVAWRFGVGAEVDAYLFVFNLVNWPVGVWSGVLAVLLIPLEARIRRERPETLGRFRAEMLAGALGVGALLSIAAAILLPGLLASPWVGLPTRTVSLALELVPLLSWFTIGGIVVGLYSTWIMSAGGHANTLLEGLPAVGILAAVLLGGGVEALAWGTLAGLLVQLSASIAVQEEAVKGRLPRFSLTSSYWTPFRRGFGVMMLGQVVISLTSIIDQFLAAGLDEGAISSLGYSARVLALVLTVFATAVTRATLPVFSSTAAEGGAGLRSLALRWAWVMGLAGIAVAAIGWAAAPTGVRLLFERGTFDAVDTASVSRILRFSLLQVPFYCASLVLVSLHSSQGRYGLLLAGAIVALVVKTTASIILLPTLGVAGLMLSYAAMYGANLLLFARAVR